MTAGSPKLSLQHVTRRFAGGVTAVCDIGIDFAPDDFVVLLGPSGCGKSTLLRLIAGLDAPDDGTLAWHGSQPAPGEIAYVFQDATLMPWATALENVALPRRLRGDPGARRAAAEALARVGLAGFEAARPARLSGGMKMRVSIARALSTDPDVLLMDEPFAALDEFTRHALQDQLRALATERRCLTIFVTHSLYEAAYLGQRIFVMTARPGRIACEFAGLAGPATTRDDPAYTALVAELSRAIAAAHTP